MNFDTERLNIDPSLMKIWGAWVDWFDKVPYWDPYGAGATLFLVFAGTGYLLFKNLAAR